MGKEHGSGGYQKNLGETVSSGTVIRNFLFACFAVLVGSGLFSMVDGPHGVKC